MRLFARCCLLVVVWSCTCASQEPTKKPAAAQARALSRSLSRLVANGGGALITADIADADVPARFRAWLTENNSALLKASPSPFAKSPPWGVATVRKNSLFLHVHTWPEDGKLLLPRLHNSVAKVYLRDDLAELKLTPLVHEWEIQLPAKPRARDVLLPIITMELDGPPVVATTAPPIVKPSGEGDLVLHARQAITHGTMLRFEPQPHKNTVGYWVKQDDWVEWSCETASQTTYDVHLRYGCGEGQGGSEIAVSVGGEVLPFTVEATGGFQAWRNVGIGRVRLSPGRAALTVKVQRKAKNAVMDIQSIFLIPIVE